MYTIHKQPIKSGELPRFRPVFNDRLQFFSNFFLSLELIIHERRAVAPVSRISPIIRRIGVTTKIKRKSLNSTLSHRPYLG